ncbi:MAG: hypothetical protein CBC36_03405 [Verrucomicrobiaceae bacterium TMED76]|nr:MAG: hypothetical protein CBC36_03405 [Verrucomicrobiaceae bacterium TMED76]
MIRERCGRFPQGEPAPKYVVRLLGPCSNAVIHVIEPVLLPPAVKSSSLQNNGSAKGLTEQAMYLGTHQFNKGNHFAYGSLYEIALHSQIVLPEDLLSQENLKALKISTDKAELHPSPIQSAYLMRQAMDSVFISRKEECFDASSKLQFNSLR